MPDDFRYAGYPSAKVFDGGGHQVQHILWGDWVKVTGLAQGGRLPVHVRGTDGFMAEADLQEERLLEIVFVDVGQGDGCLIVTPDDRKLIVDAGLADNMFRFLRWRFNFLGGVRTFDAAIITHPDSDHYQGFKMLFQEPNVRFRRIYHNGIMEQVGKPFGPEAVAGGVKYVTQLIESRQDLEQFLADPARYGQKLYANLLKAALGRLAAGGDIRMLSASGDPDRPSYVEGFGTDRDLRLRILGPVSEPAADGRRRLRWFRDRPAGGSFDPGKTKNGHSVIVTLEYRDVSILLGGDLNSSAETFLLERYTGLPWPPQDGSAEQTLVEAGRRHFGADITKSCHHGSADFTDTFLRTLHAAATVVSSGDEESHAHPRSDTLGAIGLHGRGWRPLIFSTELVRSSREDEGTRRVEIGRLLEKIDRETDPERRAQLVKERDSLLDELAERNVTTYGAINLRTDGRKAVFAYKLERPRAGVAGGPSSGGTKKTITKWDIYTMERAGGGPLVYVPRGSA
jgi:beta-lactamase superfamily II metal-dependent hydrolase